jgi:CRP-like cAMP-binding protein
VKLSVISAQGKEAVVAFLEAGGFCGEGCLAGHEFGSRTPIEDSPESVPESIIQLFGKPSPLNESRRLRRNRMSCRHVCLWFAHLHLP